MLCTLLPLPGYRRRFVCSSRHSSATLVTAPRSLGRRSVISNLEELKCQSKVGRRTAGEGSILQGEPWKWAKMIREPWRALRWHLADLARTLAPRWPWLIGHWRSTRALRTDGGSAVRSGYGVACPTS